SLTRFDNCFRVEITESKVKNNLLIPPVRTNFYQFDLDFRQGEIRQSDTGDNYDANPPWKFGSAFFAGKRKKADGQTYDKKFRSPIQRGGQRSLLAEQAAFLLKEKWRLVEPNVIAHVGGRKRRRQFGGHRRTIGPLMQQGMNNVRSRAAFNFEMRCGCALVAE